LLYLCVNQLPVDRKLTLPELTTKISRAYFLADSKRQPLTITRVDSGIQTIVVPEPSPAAFGENPTVIVAELQGGPIATILDFVLRGMPEATISGTDIRVQVPQSTDLTKLAPTYNTGSPLVTGKPASGSANDFSKPQTYTITGVDGSTKAYVVTVTPTLGAVGVSNHSFEKFDVLNETVSFNAVKRTGYTAKAAPLTVTMDGVPVLILEASQITEAWGSYKSPAFMVTSGGHTLAFTLGAGDDTMDLIDNVTIKYYK